MPNDKKYFFLGLLVFATLLPKLIISAIYFDNSILVNTIFNIESTGYFSIVISFSDFIFNPSYLDEYKETNLITFPIYGFFLHALFYKLFGIYSFFILELIFHFIFLVIFLKVVEKIFKDENFSLYFCFFIFLFISLLEVILSYESISYLRHLFNLLDEEFGTRFPRPLFTGIIYFYFFYTLYTFRENLKKFDLKYFILLFFMLAIFLNSFFYYFFNFSILLIFLIFKYLDTGILNFLLKNKKKILLILLSFIIFSLPFLIQLYFGEDDYSKRIGVIEINLDQKLYLLKYYFINLLRFESIFLILTAVIIHLYLNKKFYNYRHQVSNLNIFFYFLMISVISPPIFFIISPKIVSIYHFLDILLSIIIFYLMLSLSFIIFQKFDLKEKFKGKEFIKLIVIFLIFILNIHFANINTNENKLEINEIIKVQKFLKNNNLTNSNIKLFSNDKDIMFLWLLNKNTQLSLSWGFVNSLKNKEIEYILINNLKGFGVLETEFKSMISLGESKIRESWHMLLFCYMYVANSLHTFSDIDNFTDNVKDKIKKTSPFRAQSQVVPEDEKKRLVKLFNKIDLNNELYPEIVVLNRLGNAFNNIEFRNKNYDLVYLTDIYKIYILNK
tara:strand:+ start:90 stop:1934 length:1845 start_codon:yes stop_codon:yes gene_type:complete